MPVAMTGIPANGCMALVGEVDLPIYVAIGIMAQWHLYRLDAVNLSLCREDAGGVARIAHLDEAVHSEAVGSFRVYQLRLQVNPPIASHHPLRRGR